MENGGFELGSIASKANILHTRCTTDMTDKQASFAVLLIAARHWWAELMQIASANKLVCLSLIKYTPFLF